MNQDRLEERLEDLRWMAETGVGATEAAQRLGLGSPKSLDRFLRRCNQIGLLRQLIAQDYLDLSGSKTTRHLRRAR